MLPRIFKADTATNHYINDKLVISETIVIMEDYMEVELKFTNNNIEVEIYEFNTESEREEMIKSFKSVDCYTEQN